MFEPPESPRLEYARRLPFLPLKRSFREIIANVLLGLIIWFALSRSEAIPHLIVLTAAFAVAYVLIPVFEFGYRWCIAPYPLLKEENQTLREDLRKQQVELAELKKALAKPLSISFQPGQAPFEEPLLGVAGSKLCRVCVRNESNVDVHDITVRLDFDPIKVGMNDLLLHVHHDNTNPAQRSFSLVANDSKYIDVVSKRPNEQYAHIFHIIPGVGSAVQPGQYHVRLKLSGSGIAQTIWKFDLSVGNDLTFESQK